MVVSLSGWCSVVSIGTGSFTIASQLKAIRPHEYRGGRSRKAGKRNSTVGYELDFQGWRLYTLHRECRLRLRQTEHHETKVGVED